MSERDESEDGFALALEQAYKLREIDPDHELLRFFAQGGKDDDVWEEFQKRFGKPEISKEIRSSVPAQAYFYVQYFIALRDANESFEKSAQGK